MLDLVEMLEKADWECAHLILVSLSYLLDFLIAVDFLGCESLKAGLEKKVKDKISDSNRRDVLNYIKHIPGLDNTIKHSMTPICSKLVKLDVGKARLSMEDPYMQEYAQFTPDLFKLMLKNDCLGNCLKFRILRNWFFENSEAKGEMIELLKIIQFKDLEESKVEEIVSEVKTWNIGEGHKKCLNEVIENAKKEKELERLEKEKMDEMRVNINWKLGYLMIHPIFEM